MTPTLKRSVERLQALSACEGGLEFVKAARSPRQAWESGDNPDWLGWLAVRLPLEPQLVLRATCAVVRVSADSWPGRGPGMSAARRLLKAAEAVAAGRKPAGTADADFAHVVAQYVWTLPAVQQNVLAMVIDLHRFVVATCGRAAWPGLDEPVCTPGDGLRSWASLRWCLAEVGQHAGFAMAYAELERVPDAAIDDLYSAAGRLLVPAFTAVIPYELIAKAAGLPAPRRRRPTTSTGS